MLTPRDVPALVPALEITTTGRLHLMHRAGSITVEVAEAVWAEVRPSDEHTVLTLAHIQMRLGKVDRLHAEVPRQPRHVTIAE
jgi:hypothetical protein